MNREIKFRAWCTPENIMLSNKQLSEVGGYYYDFGVKTNIDGYTLMQYTGLKDKNGVEIYEGDIVVTNNKRNFKVEYRGSSFDVISLEKGDKNTLAYSDYLDYANDIGLEVIGNIYENPELIK